MSSYFERLASVRDVLNLNRVNKEGVLVIAEKASILDAAQFLAKQDIGLAVVINANKTIVGVFSERDLVNGVAANAQSIFSMTVRELMNRDVLVCAPTDHLKSLASKMAHSHVRHVVVRDGERCIGVVSARDILLFAGDG